MIRIRGMTRLGMFVALAVPVAAGADDGDFRKLTLDQARQAASESGKKLVLVDVYTTWCAPCKKLDETTWKDPRVLEWLTREAVCLKVDAEKDEPLAEKYRIKAYPTLLLLRPDGSEIDRLVGYRDAPTFLSDAGEALAGNDSLSRARKKLEGPGALDPMLRMSYGDALGQKGRAEDALSEYLWCFDHGLEHGPGFTGVRLSFLLSKIVELSRSNPAAADELRKRRDAAAKRIEAGQADFETAMSFAALNSNLGEVDRTLAMYNRIKADAAQPELVKSFLFDQSLDLLLKAKRYREIVEGANTKAKVRELLDRHEQVKERMPDNAMLRGFMKKQVSVGAAKYYEALLGSGDKGRASDVANLLVAFDPDEAYVQLIAAARRADDPKTADALSEASRKPAKSEARP